MRETKRENKSFDLLLIRHGLTAWNAEKRYIGKTDLPLSEAGISQLRTKWPQPPCCQYLYSSPTLRCLQTAEVIFPGRAVNVVPGFRELAFGYFEGKTATEMMGDPLYEAWLESGGQGQIPGGESMSAFVERCTGSFRSTIIEIEQNRKEDEGCRSDGYLAALIVHGGTIMALMSALGYPPRSFFDTMLKCGGSLACRWDGKQLREIEPK